jgi:hypothetical protein
VLLKRESHVPTGDGEAKRVTPEMYEVSMVGFRAKDDAFEVAAMMEE